MSDSGSQIRSRILEQRMLLEKARAALKDEFFGINHVIDAVVDAISPWFLTPGIQERPLVVNLWGLTGTGKTSLAIRTAELLGKKGQLLRFDLGTGDFGARLFNELEKLPAPAKREPRIFIFDEFQNARTIDPKGLENEPTEMKVVWNFLDSGKIISPWGFRIRRPTVVALRTAMALAINEGIGTSNGQVSGDAALYNQIMGRSEPSSEVFTKEELDSIADYALEDTFSLRRRIAGMSPPEIMRMLDGFCSEAISQKEIDCSSSLVFVIGNLDEAYEMTGELSPDLEPDEFRETTLKITIPMIKKALQKRFRNEQISRLGNNHIIYPALGSEDYRRIIQKRLEEITNRILRLSGVLVEMRPSIEELVFAEGVYPTQGTRPLLSTIENIVKSPLGRFLADAFREGASNPERLVLDYRDGIMHSVVWAGGTKIDSTQHSCSLELGRLRENKGDDFQAIVSVHEAGHAAIAILLLGRIPGLIRSRTADASSMGFMSGSVFDSTIVKGDLVKRIALLLGGRAAETLVFGELMVTDGVRGDLVEATNFALSAAKSCGMCANPASHRERDLITNHFFHDRDDRMEIAAEGWIEEARKLALDTLERHEDFLIDLARMLFERTILRRSEIETLVLQHLPDFMEQEHIGEGTMGRYVAKLKIKIKSLTLDDVGHRELEAVRVACSGDVGQS